MVRRMITCPTCKGSGQDDSWYFPCPICGGYGTIGQDSADPKPITTKKDEETKPMETEE